jgi:hypothetical protein
VIGFRDASLAVVIGAQVWRACEHEKASECRGSKCRVSKE